MSEGLILNPGEDEAGKPVEGNSIQDAYVPDFIKDRRRELEIVGPFIFLSGFKVDTREVIAPCALHMDQIEAISPLVDTRDVGGITQHVIHGSVVFTGQSNSTVAYSPEEIIDAIRAWNPGG